MRLHTSAGPGRSDRRARLIGRVASGDPVSLRLSAGGRLHVERHLPFLCVARRAYDADAPGVEWLVLGESAHLVTTERSEDDEASALALEVARAQARAFGAFLVLEVWCAPAEGASASLIVPPRFRIRVPEDTPTLHTVSVLEDALARIRLYGTPADVSVDAGADPHPPHLPALFDAAEVGGTDGPALVAWLGVEVAPVWIGPTGATYPIVRRDLRRPFADAIKQTLFDFAWQRTSHRPKHFHTLGRRAFGEAFWQVDRELAEIDGAYDFVLQMTPLNVEAARSRFERGGGRGAPAFVYRPWPIDPDEVKRRLWSIRIEDVEDPTLAELFQEKRRELDLKAGMVEDRGTRNVLWSTLQLYGTVEDGLLETARDVLARLEPAPRSDAWVDARGVAERASAEIAHYRTSYPEMRSRVEIRPDFPGLMVSRGNLLVGEGTRVADARLEAVIHHEVGTHIVTYFNGRAQPLRQLACGVAGYEELQEGLAVLCEHLGGNLTARRLRLLAARVLAAHSLAGGADFPETFRMLAEHGFGPRSAFGIAMRVHRGGGVMKDAIYLRGLLSLIEHLRSGGDFERLFIGKIAVAHVPIVEELGRRGLLRPAPLRPRLLDDERAMRRLQRVRAGLHVTSLVEGAAG